MRCWFLATLAPLIVTEPLSGKGRIHFKLLFLLSLVFTLQQVQSFRKQNQQQEGAKVTVVRINFMCDTIQTCMHNVENGLVAVIRSSLSVSWLCQSRRLHRSFMLHVALIKHMVQI